MYTRFKYSQFEMWTLHIARAIAQDMSFEDPILSFRADFGTECEKEWRNLVVLDQI
uniref:Uncharacterized protein n=1 Tax=mine drainage metagenome TaxID=410659 RepID=E6QVJ6_9ZZZZ